jgi:hypothetical protein
VHEHGGDHVVEDNIVFGAGVDVLGNGRSGFERPFGYGDGISTSSRNALVRNNLVIDASDEGIMVQGGPGTRVESNVVAAISREMLGGIALIDPSAHYVLDPERRRFDYRDVVVSGNLIDARGARVHIGVALGAPCWMEQGVGTTLVGARIVSNLVSGGAHAYGFAAAGVDAFTVQGNRSNARYSGSGDGMPGYPPDPPAAFLFDANTVGESALQEEFRPAQRHLVHLMRNFWEPSGPLGYRAASYGEHEAQAVVETAYHEMLGRPPAPDEAAHWSAWLHQSHAKADTLRRVLMTDPVFMARHGARDPRDLHRYRTERWLGCLRATFRQLAPDGASWPRAMDLYEGTLAALAED